jgi:hypothetical protein
MHDGGAVPDVAGDRLLPAPPGERALRCRRAPGELGRHPLDLGDVVDVVSAWDDGASIAFAVEGVTRAVARVERL